MLQRKNGATLAEIMTTMGWQKHTVRGFMAGTMNLETAVSRPATPKPECLQPPGSKRVVT